MEGYGPQKIEFHGLYENRRYLVVIDGRDVFLGKKLFRYLYIMALRRKSATNRKIGGWVKRSDLDSNRHRCNQMMYELRGVLRGLLSGEWDYPVESSTAPTGKFRLNIGSDCEILYDLEILKQFPDTYVQEETFNLIEREKAITVERENADPDSGNGATAGRHL
ncbi:MAG: hypothetical protein ACE5GA_00125 [Candidatus Zixiibacteriota bacterium]